MGHACEWETSMILQIAPALVGDYRTLTDVPFGRAFDPGYRAWITTDRSRPGHIGSPRAATVEKGERLLDHFAAQVRAWIERLVRWDGQSWEG
jgi:creatinine amidohydrolase